MEKKVKVGISGILIKNNKFLLGQRDNHDTQGGKWVTAGGGLEFGETIDAGIKREYFEETGLQVEVTPKFSTVQERIHDRHVVMIFKTVECADLSKLIAGDGFQKVEFFTLQEIKDLNRKSLLTDMTFKAISEYSRNQD